MSTKLKALGIALFAALAVGAVGVVNAGATSGGHFTSSADWTILDAKQEHPPAAPTGVFVDTSTTPDNEIECGTINFSASAGNKTVSAITASAIFANCSTKGFISAPAVVHMNGCDFLLTVGPNPASADQTVHLKCPTTTTPSHVKHEVTVTIDPPIFGTCTVHIPEQTSTSGGAVYTPITGTNGKKSITIDITVIGTTQNKTEQGFGCLGSGGEDNASDLFGKVIVEGKDTDNNPVDLTAEGNGNTTQHEHETDTHAIKTHEETK